MMVLHVFEEKDQLNQDEHLEFWFGYPELGPAYDEESDTQMCYCGAEMIVMERSRDNEITVAAMWHTMRFDPKFFSEKWYEDE